MHASLFLALTAAALFGAATPLSKALLGSINPFMLAGLLYLGAGIMLAPQTLRSGFRRKIQSLDRKNIRYVVGSIICGGMLGPVLLLFGLKLAKSASVSLWLNLELVATAILGHFFFRDRMTPRSALATLGILGAAMLLSFEGGSTGIAGGLLVGAACISWGFDNHFTALIDGLNPEESTFIKGIVAGTTNLAIGIAVSKGSVLALPSLAAALVIGALSYGASIVLYISSAQGLGASRAQLFFSSSPLFGLVIATVLLDESFTPAQGLALAIMLLSYAILLSERHGHRHEHSAAEHTHWHRHGEDHHDHAHARSGLMARLFGHSHPHPHAAIEHEHRHVSDIHHRHEHA
ncbi:MAG: hypothetical protein A2Y38_21230 [Spirochaetes bacterium GWB1_59_5]|nr:MAG: hypothetical protein A2Y38_21230 [Spirochaetes bacterium GWB1_59_5]